jgi:hypothetical protein
MIVSHPFNFFAGWAMVLAAFITGAAIGLFFHRSDFWGGYASFRRRIVRLGHIALAALGMINVLYALGPWPVAGTLIERWASACLALGGVAMPAVCFLAGWRERARVLFALPVVLLIIAVVLILCGGAR